MRYDSKRALKVNVLDSIERASIESRHAGVAGNDLGIEVGHPYDIGKSVGGDGEARSQTGKCRSAATRPFEKDDRTRQQKHFGRDEIGRSKIQVAAEDRIGFARTGLTYPDQG